MIQTFLNIKNSLRNLSDDEFENIRGLTSSVKYEDLKTFTEKLNAIDNIAK